MRTFFSILLCLLPLMGISQFTMVEEFNPSSSWTYTNGAGMQNYGGVENYASFNVGSTPYLNSSTITITSPVYDLTTCIGVLTISFPMAGIIENGYDYAYFEYRIGAGPWTTVATFTGSIALTTFSTIPNTATQFRFRLVTDASLIVWYRSNLTDPKLTPDGVHTVPVDISNSFVFNVPPRTVLVYYYDITRFTIDCSSTMPIELLSFTGTEYPEYNLIKWITASEINNDYFLVERSFDAVNFYEVGKTPGAGNSSSNQYYEMKDFDFTKITYYRLTQTDFDGKKETFGLLTVSRLSDFNEDLKLVKRVNLLGQEIDEDYDGIQILIFSNGSTIKKWVKK